MEVKKRILFVDDDKSILDGIRRVFRMTKNAWKMEFLTNAKDAIEVMKSTNYDMIVTDMQMPGINGLCLLEHVKDNYPAMIRFMLTGFADEDVRNKAYKWAHQFICKPFDTVYLRDMIASSFDLQNRFKSIDALEKSSSLCSLPTLPEAYKEVMDMLNDPSYSSRDIGTAISRDMGMSAKILQVANSSVAKDSNKVLDPIQAVIFLGLSTIEALILSEGVFNKLDQSVAEKFFVDSLQEHSLRVGCMARMICQNANLGPSDMESAMMAGILHDCGKVALISEFPEKYREAIELSRKEGIPLFQAELEIIGVSHDNLGGYLMHLWGLPTAIIESTSYHHEPEMLDAEGGMTVLKAVYLADQLDHLTSTGRGDGVMPRPNMIYLEDLELSHVWDEYCAPLTGSYGEALNGCRI